MADDGVTTANVQSAVVVHAGDLPVFCPNPAMPLWSSHPRVFLDVAGAGEAKCGNRGTRYRLEGDAKAGH
jgi:uncharacterized Zn-finger protein